MRSKLTCFLAVLCFAAPAAAQQVLFTEDFEDGIAGWTPTGLWNAEDASNPCGSWAAPFPSGTGVAYFGHDFPCDYELPGPINVGSLTWDGWIDLPAGAASISLRFWMASQSEYCWGGWDLHELWIDVENGSSHLFELCADTPNEVATLPWHERRIELTTLGGSRIRPRFHFDSVDGQADYFRGWFVDDVSVIVEPGVRVCPGSGFATGCPCAPQPGGLPIPVAGGCRNSTNQSAVLVSSGAPVVSADTLSITVRNLPPNASCILAQASASGNSTWFGDGVRCVSGQVRRMGIVAASNGVASWPPPGTDPIALRGLVPAAGGTRYYYVNYRDVLPWCTSATFNLTDAQRIVWVP